MPNPAAPSSVLLLGWDDTTPALPLARTLATTTATELWTATALPAAPTTAARFQQHSLDVMPAAPALALGHKVPAFPYVGRGVGQPLGLDLVAGQPVAVPAAPYIGSSEAPPAYSANPAGSAPGAIARTSFGGADRPMRLPAAPYVGATHEEAARPASAQPLLAAPVPDYRVPIAALPAPPAAESVLHEPYSVVPAAPLIPAVSLAAGPVASSAAAPASGAEPGPAEAAELSSETTTETAALGAAELATGPPADSAPTPAAAELLPSPPAAFDDAELNAEDVALLATGAANDAADLNFRIIEYARHAARRAYESEFEVIFAPDWHTWLAGVELRQLTRRPLVLQVTQLAADLAASPAERGWMEALERITLPQADRILVPDEATAARLRQRYRHLAGRVYVLPAGAPELAAALVLNSRFSR